MSDERHNLEKQFQHYFEALQKNEHLIDTLNVDNLEEIWIIYLGLKQRLQVVYNNLSKLPSAVINKANHHLDSLNNLIKDVSFELGDSFHVQIDTLFQASNEWWELNSLIPFIPVEIRPAIKAATPEILPVFPWKPIIVFLTAVDVEYKALKPKLINVTKSKTEQGTIFELGEIPGLDARIVLGCTEMGNISAALMTQEAIGAFRPDLIAFVGIAGGVKDLELGDVVVADQVHYYEKGKDDTVFKARPTGHQLNYQFSQGIRYLIRNAKWQSKITGKKFSAKMGAVCVGEKVLATDKSNLYAFITTHLNHALAVDMESAGFVEAVHRTELGDRWVIVRGISDKIKDKSETDSLGYQEVAVEHAIDCAIAIINDCINLLRTQKIKFTAVEDLPLSGATFNVLKGAKINCLSDLKPEILASLPSKSREELSRLLQQWQFELD